MSLRRLLLVVLALVLPVPSLRAAVEPQAVGVLIIAHGASASWNAPVEASAARVSRTIPAEVGFLMGDGATPQQAYDKLVARGVGRIVVVPMLISSYSPHADQIKFIAGLRPDYPHAEHMVLTAVHGSATIIGVTPAMDDDPVIGSILASHARALSHDPANETLVLVAHGPNEDDEAALWTKSMTRLADQIKHLVPFRKTDVRLLRDDAPASVKDRALAELKASVAGGAKSGRVVVVPLLLAPGSVADEIPSTLEGLDFAWDGKTLLPDDKVADWVISRAQGAIAAAGTPSGVGAQELAGVVRDTSGSAASGATVVLRSEATGLQRVDHADARGAFAFRDVPAGRYELIASLSGFAAHTTIVTAPSAQPMAIALQPAPYEEAVTVVSDGRADRLRGTTTQPVVVIDGQAMRDAADATVADALRGVPGVVSRRGSEGAETGGEQVQGVDSRQVLVLIDGQPVVGARGIKSGVINLDQQSTFGLDRVEVVKGSASALYGSDAMGGVINLIPRDPRKPLEFSGRAAGGDKGASEFAGDVGGQARGVGVFLSAGRRARDSFDLTPTTADTTGASFTRDNLLARGTVATMRSWLFTGTTTSYWNDQTGKSAGELGLEQDQTTSNSQTYGLRANWTASSNTTVELRAYHGRYSETSTGFLVSPAQTPVDPGDLYEGLTKLDASMVRLFGQRQVARGGAEWSDNTYRGRNRIRDAAGDSASTGVVWGQYEINPISSMTLTAGLRYDNNSAFGGATSPKVAVVEQITRRITARASYGRGFRAPDLGQLYYRFLNPTNLYQVIGNPQLQPERSESFEAGADFGGARARVGVNAFHNRVTNLIQAVSLGFVATQAQLDAISASAGIDSSFNVQLNRLLFLYQNVAQARTEGVELTGELRPMTSLRIAGGYTYLDAIDLTTGADLTNRNPHQGALRVDWSHRPSGLRVNLSGAFFSSWIAGTSRSVAGTSNIVAPRFALWDLAASKTIVAGIEAFVALDNFTNSQDPNTGQLAADGSALPIYRPEIGRTWRAGVTWSWNR